jgi:hypothetical protein
MTVSDKGKSAFAGIGKSPATADPATTGAKAPFRWPDPPTPDGERPIQLAIWGGVGSGKSTFIGAIRRALEASAYQKEWSMDPLDDDSYKYGAAAAAALRGEAPLPTATTDALNLSWTLRGPVGEAGTVQVTLRLRDAPGGDYQKPGTSGTEDTLAHLAGADGLIYLYDPTLDLPDDDGFSGGPAGPGGHRDEGPVSAATAFDSTLSMLTFAANRAGHTGVQLPHFLAICVTKIDDPRVFRAAAELGLVDSNDDGSPWVPDELAREFFRELCVNPRYGNAPQIWDSVASRFAADRTSFFATSALGFSRGSGNDALGLRTWPNRAADADGGYSVREVARPINVFEPLRTLVSEIAQRRPAVAGR